LIDEHVDTLTEAINQMYTQFVVGGTCDWWCTGSEISVVGVIV